jgi:pantoate--beta-alanine ligase
MKIIKTIHEMQEQALAWRREGVKAGFVPTMGALHEGHLSLIDQARRAGAAKVVVSIFVNPTQFGPSEDLDKYPRNFARDEALCAGRGADVIFYPDAAEMYASGHSTWVVEEQLSKPLCGESRPGHFRGVATVVAKLFNIVLPDVAVFGQKDAQQSLVIQRMVRDLNFPLTVVIAPIVRESDGLAMSSRNQYLSSADRAAAPVIYRSLLEIQNLCRNGERNPRFLRQVVSDRITEAGGRIDYIEIVSREDLRQVEEINGRSLVAVAAFFGKTRLIDNIFIG